MGGYPAGDEDVHHAGWWVVYGQYRFRGEGEGRGSTDAFEDGEFPQIHAEKAPWIKDLCQCHAWRCIRELLENLGVLGIAAVDDEVLVAAETAGEGRDGGLEAVM